MNGNTMRVLFLSHSDGIGGAELALLNLAVTFREQGTVQAEVLLPGQGELFQRLQAQGIPCRVFPLLPAVTWTSTPGLRIRGILKHILLLGRLVSMLRPNPPDLLVTNTSVLIQGVVTSMLLRRPHVWWIHEDPWNMDYSWLFPERWMRQLFCWKGTRFVFVSEHLREVWTERIPDIQKRSVVLPQIIHGDLPPRREPVLPPDQGPHLVIVGMFHPKKAQKDALHALARLTRRGHRAHLWLVGDGPMRPRLQQLARQLNLQGRVHMVGTVPPETVPMYYDQADLVISTSHIESMPRTTMEAFLVGAPTILTDLPVYRSLGLRHREHAWLYPPGDVERLAEGIAFLLDHPDERKRMARAGQRWARALLPGPAEVARAWSALFKEVGRG